MSRNYMLYPHFRMNRIIALCFSLVLMIPGCLKSSAYLLEIGDDETQDRSYSFEAINNGVSADVEVSLARYYNVVYVSIDLINKSDTDYLVAFNYEDIWHEGCEGEKVFLDQIFETDHGIDVESYTLSEGGKSGLGLTFNRPKCLPFNNSDEETSFNINLGGIYFLDGDNNSLDLINEIKVYSKKG